MRACQRRSRHGAQHHRIDHRGEQQRKPTSPSDRVPSTECRHREENLGRILCVSIYAFEWVGAPVAGEPKLDHAACLEHPLLSRVIIQIAASAWPVRASARIDEFFLLCRLERFRSPRSEEVGDRIPF